MANIINGKERAAFVKEKLKEIVGVLKNENIIPRLDVLLIGEDHASHIYVKHKEKACEAVGMESVVHRYPEDVKEGEILHQIRKLNENTEVHGILVQLPIPKTISAEKVLNTIDPDKDVDGLIVHNMGQLIKGEGDPLIPCTPQGIIDLIHSTGHPIEGKHAVVIGRSNIVGKPVSILLLKENATVTICHSKTKHLYEITKQADILIAAIGRAKFVKKEMVKTGAIVIDVGMNRDENGKLAGDVDFENVQNVAGYITPVPGGVGPMTIAMLLKNTIKAARKIMP